MKKALLNTSNNISNNNNITSKADDYKQLLSNLCIVGQVDVPKRIMLRFVKCYFDILNKHHEKPGLKSWFLFGSDCYEYLD